MNRNIGKMIFCVLAACLFFTPGWSNTVKAGRKPGIIAKLGGGKHQAMVLQELDVAVRIHGAAAETKMTMTFYNPHSRVLEGQLYFPLPEGAFISGYALDINGVMVDGVVVEKKKARQVFENVVRRKIDPGLIEWAAGNNFKTRIYPLLPKQTRKISIRYISQVEHRGQETYFRLPVGFKQKVRRFSLRVEAVKVHQKPVVIRGVPKGFQFKKWGESYLAEALRPDYHLASDLLIRLPRIRKPRVLVEQSKTGNYHFCIALRNEETGAGQSQSKKNLRLPRHITLYWDASHSRGKMDHGRELKLLKSYFSQFKHTVRVDLVVFRHRRFPARLFRVAGGDAGKLLTALKELDYDGGTGLQALAPLKDKPKPGLYMVFSDGMGNFGEGEPGSFQAPVFVFSGSRTANHALLRHIARSSGGRYFNLNRMEDSRVLKTMNRESPYIFMSAEFKGGTLSQVFPGPGQPVDGPFVLCGRLLTAETAVTLSFGRGGNVIKRVSLKIRKQDAVSGQMVETFWAQKKISRLMVNVRQNHRELVDTGTRYGLVTPGTSLLVLDNLNQYVQYEIRPPETMPRMRTQYDSIMDRRGKSRDDQRRSKLDRVVNLWRNRVNWWNRTFLPPPPPPPPKKKKKKPTAANYLESPIEVPVEIEEEGDLAALGYDFGVEGGVEGSVEGGVTGGVLGATSNAEQPASGRRPLNFMGKGGAPAPPPAPKVSIQAWNPETPYLEALQGSDSGRAFAMYLEQKKEFADSPAFYLDCAGFFFKHNQKATGLQVLSNIAELELENPALLRVLAHRLRQLGYLKLSTLVFEKVLEMRPEEPQSYRDLAVVLEQRKQYKRAVKLFYDVVMGEWRRFQEIEVTALMELNRCLAQAKTAGLNGFGIDDRLVKLLDVDVRIVLTWDADATDMDLWITDPTGEKSSYKNKLSRIGGLMSRDFTQGYGPEEYVLKKAVPGAYKIMVDYFGSRAQTLMGPVTLQVDIYTNYGRENEKKQSITLRLADKKEKITVGEVSF
jgi:hypothetical protein